MHSESSFEVGKPLALKPGTLPSVREKLRSLANPVHGRPSRVVVLLSASRSGSTTVHDLLSRCPGVAALPGEVEPYLRLTGNAQGVDGSNQIKTPRDLNTLRTFIRSDLREWSKPAEPDYRYRMRRLLLQWPEASKPLDKEWYDGGKMPSVDLPVLEEPPLVPLSGAERPDSLDGKTVILKTPQLVYRRPVIRRIFSGIPIVYVWLQRSFAGTINGLLDGWYGPHFWSYNLPAPRGAPLPDWWCFDVPPGWQSAASMNDAASLQWLQANTFASKFPIQHRLKYEDLWRGGAQRLAADLGLDATGLETRRLMVTKDPSVHRWTESRPHLIRLIKSKSIHKMMAKMGYNTNKVGVEW